MINALLKLKPSLSMRPRNIHQVEVYIALSLQDAAFRLSSFADGIPTPSSTCGGLSGSVDLRWKAMLFFFKQFLLSLAGIAYD